MAFGGSRSSRVWNVPYEREVPLGVLVPMSITRKYMDYIKLSECRVEMKITNLPNERSLSWIFFHHYVDFAVVQSRRNLEDDGKRYTKFDSEHCIRASRTFYNQDDFKNFLLLFKAAALGRMKRIIKEIRHAPTHGLRNASTWQIQDVPGEPGLEYCIQNDLTISINVSEINTVLKWEDRINNLWHKEFDDQICKCSLNNEEIPPPITLMEVLTGAKEIPNLSDPDSDSNTDER